MNKIATYAMAGAALAAMWTGAAQAQSMPAGNLSTQPIGHYEFCLREAAECRSNAGSTAPVELTRSLWSRIIEVNNLVNTMITPRTDWEMWGVEEYWSYPVAGYGDCEDYALEKRRLLMQAGIPASSLLMTVVRQPNGEGHAVLTVRTSMGDYILDNLELRVLPWTQTQYRYLKRQTPHHAGQWETIHDGRDVLVGSVGR
jgi:predicted transglutaminase-like cysteine proteinase